MNEIRESTYESRWWREIRVCMEMENRKIGLIGTKDGREEKEITLNFRQVDR